MEEAGIDIITDGEIRREAYSNRFATSLQGIDPEPHMDPGSSRCRATAPRIVGKIRRIHPVELRDMEFLRAHTRGEWRRSRCQDRLRCRDRLRTIFYADMDEAVMDYAVAVNEEALYLQRAGADVIQLDEPWVRNDPESAKRIAVPAINGRYRGSP